MAMRASSIFDLPASPAGHYKLYFLATVFHVIEQAAASSDSAEALFEQFPFLTAYLEEVPLPPERGPTFWPGSVQAFEAHITDHLPLRALRDAAGLDHRAITLLLAVGLIEEDARFGALFDAMQDTTALRRPTLGLLNAWWREPVDGGEVRAALRRLRELGLVQVVNPEAPRIEWALHAPSLLWDAIRGETPEAPAPQLRYRALDTLPPLRALILPDTLSELMARVPSLLASGDARALVVRGPRRNGRRTVLAAVARSLGLGLLDVSGLGRADDERWRAVGPLATLLHALPMITLDPGPGETVEIPALAGYEGPLGLVLGKQGGVSGPGAEGALTLALPMPEPDARRRHWGAGLAGHPCAELDDITQRFRMTSGNIRRAAALSRSYAALRGGGAVELADVRQASRALNRQALDTLATRLDAEGSWKNLAASAEMLRDLENVAARCRHRERLHALVGEALRGQVNPGVRALFQGPSGTGKTLAAKLLAAELGMDLYRVELSSVVSKFIGETEKNLGQIFALAEELDIILLLDEGDSLLTQRTAVQTSNDRYANLETNYLLQRIESFEGIVVITTNAGELIDGAFQRRMDVVVDFRAPEGVERLRIWHLHLPAEHAVDATLLRDLAARCALSGGQIRNAVLHASLLALGEGVPVATAHIEAAAQREYRRMGGVYPLRRRAGGEGART
ncbi:ATP-binding protein [Sorangium sp. So ce887]|uniref:ATP-binding protein n=1 Tax=Sorangium sp. So ce887 TaxID=3133324 RepID=UPI003F628534